MALETGTFEPAGGYLDGHILIAMSGMMDDRFERVVIYSVRPFGRGCHGGLSSTSS